MAVGTLVYASGVVVRINETCGCGSVLPFFARSPMPALRINMRKLKDALRLKFERLQILHPSFFFAPITLRLLSLS